MSGQAVEFKLEPQERRKIEKRRRQEKDARIHKRLAALLWLADGRAISEVASLLDVTAHTVRNWVKLYKKRARWRRLLKLSR
jgi:transposase